jgi:hypothetical protein
MMTDTDTEKMSMYYSNTYIKKLRISIKTMALGPMLLTTAR